MKRDNIIFAVGGAIIGTLGGFFAAKAHYQKVYEEYANDTIEQMRELLYRTAPDVEEWDESEDDEDSVNPVRKVDWNEKKAEEVRERLERNRSGTNYAAIYGTLKEDKTHEREETDSEDPEDTEDDGAEAEDAYEPEVARRHEANKGRKPHLISADKAAELPDGVDHVELQFYDEDNILADVDTEERIYDVEKVVGDCLTKYGFIDSDEQVIYVMNEELDTCYEIMRVDASYEETHPE